MFQQLFMFVMGYGMALVPELSVFTKFNLIESVTVSNDTLFIVFTKECLIPLQFYSGDYTKLLDVIRNMLKTTDIDVVIPEDGLLLDYSIQIENTDQQKVTFLNLSEFKNHSLALFAKSLENKAEIVAEHQHSGLYEITFTSGKSLIEPGADEYDIREFIRRSYASHGPIKTITEWRR